MKESIEVVRLLWTQDTTDYDGEFFTLRDARCNPKPVQSPPRIWVGASGEQIGLKLAVRHGDGWNVPFVSPEDFSRKLAIVRGAAPDPDRLPVGVNVGLVVADEDGLDDALRLRFGPRAGEVKPGVRAGSVPQITGRVDRYVEAGADWIVVALRAPFELNALEAFAAEVVPQFR